jgi:hypothetical protein
MYVPIFKNELQTVVKHDCSAVQKSSFELKRNKKQRQAQKMDKKWTNLRLI